MNDIKITNMGMIANLLRVSPMELEAYKNNSALLSTRIRNGNATVDEQLYDIDKSWDGIIYLLTGNNSSDMTHPLSKIIFSGQLIDKHQNLGTGPAHYLTPQQVNEIHEEIKSISSPSLRAKFDIDHMKNIGVYPNVWDHEDAADYLIEYYETVQEVFALAAAQEQAVITFIV